MRITAKDLQRKVDVLNKVDGTKVELVHNTFFKTYSLTVKKGTAHGNCKYVSSMEPFTARELYYFLRGVLSGKTELMK